MRKIIQSYNTTVVGVSFVRFLIPEPAHAVLYFALSLLLLMVFNLPVAWSFLTAGGPGLTEIASNSSRLVKAWHLVSNSNLTAGVFWGILGGALYIAAWFFTSIITNIRNDLLAASYVHPVTYKEYRFWRSMILRKLGFGLSFIMLVIYIYGGLKLMPGLAHYSYWLLGSHRGSIIYVKLAGIVAATMLLLHGFSLILKITLNFWQFIYRDL